MRMYMRMMWYRVGLVEVLEAVGKRVGKCIEVEQRACAAIGSGTRGAWGRWSEVGEDRGGDSNKYVQCS